MPANPKKRTPESQDALTSAENIIATLREPFVVLDKNLHARTANTAIYRDFHASKEEPGADSSTFWATVSGVSPDSGRFWCKS